MSRLMSRRSYHASSGELSRSSLELFGMDVQRRRQSGAGRFGKHAGDVVEGSDPVPSEVPPPWELGSIEDAGFSFFFQFVGDMSTVPTVLPPDEGIRIRTNGITIGRNIKPGS